MKKTLTKFLCFLFQVCSAVYLLTYNNAAFAQTAIIPDTAFRAYLVRSYPQVMDTNKKLVIARAATVTGSMTINSLDVRDLSGIEYFISLNNITLRYDKYLTSIPGLSGITSAKGADGSFVNSFTFQIEDCPVREFPAMPDNLSIIGLYYNEYITKMPVLAHPENLMVINTIDTRIEEYNVALYPNLNVFNATYNTITPRFTFGYNPKLEGVNLHHNGLTSLPDLSSLTKLYNLYVSAGPTSIGVMNKLTFEDLIQLKTQQPALPVDTLTPSQTSIKYFHYWPMDTIGKKQTINIHKGGIAVINLGIDSAVTTNKYQWYKNGSPDTVTTVNSIAVPYDSTVQSSVYRCKVTNPAFPLLELYSYATTVVFTKSQLVEIPDANFRQCLLDSFPQIFDAQQKLIVDKAATVHHITCSNRNINSMSGVEYFTKLLSLDCSYNQLTSLPGLGGIQWQYDSAGFDLICYSNKLTELPRLPDNVTGISASNNNLSSLAGIEHPENIDIINISSNNFTVLPDMSVFPKLTYFASMNNNWTSLPDLSENIQLTTLYVNGNLLTTLPGLSSFTNLNRLWVQNNKLSFKQLLAIQNPALSDSSQLNNSFIYAPQDSIDTAKTINLDRDISYTLVIDTDDTLSNNVYKWYRNGAIIATTSKNTYTIANSSEAGGTYICMVTNPALPTLTLYSRPQTVYVSPWSTVIAGEENHIIIIPSQVPSYINGSVLQYGDYIGVFFHNETTNEYNCGGYVQWQGASTSITAYGNTSVTETTNGFKPNEAFVFKIWKSSQQKEYTVTTLYDTLSPFVPGNYKDNALSRVKVFFAPLMAECTPQIINLYKGWNLISFNVTPADSAMKNILAGISPVIVKNAAGTILYAPQNNINNGSWNIKQGYQVYVTQNTVLSVCGTLINLNTPINIPQNPYPYFLPYFKTSQQPVSSTLSSIESGFQYVQSNEYTAAASAIMAFNYIPTHVISPAINQIGNMKPGLAYKVMATSAVTFNYGSTNSTGRLSSSAVDSVLAPQYFTNPSNTTGNNSILIIPVSSLDGSIAIGDEIGVFAPDGSLAGSAVYNGTSMAIAVWENEGMKPGDQYEVKVWKNDSHTVAGMDIAYSKGDGSYSANSLQVAGPLRITSVLENAGSALTCYPNPAQNYVDVIPGKTGEYTIAFYNMLGEKTLSTTSSVNSVTDSVRIDISGLSSGIYNYSVYSGGKVSTGKLAVAK